MIGCNKEPFRVFRLPCQFLFLLSRSNINSPAPYKKLSRLIGSMSRLGSDRVHTHAYVAWQLQVKLQVNSERIGRLVGLALFVEGGHVRADFTRTPSAKAI